MSYVFVFSFLYFVRFLSPRPAKTARPILTIYTSNDAVFTQGSDFWGIPLLATTSKGFIFPKHPQNSAANRDFQLKVFRLYVADG
jgi:hypothetical protein